MCVSAIPNGGGGAGKQRAEDGGRGSERRSSRGKFTTLNAFARRSEVGGKGKKETSFPAGPSNSDHQLHYRLGLQLIDHDYSVFSLA